jgi:hypothetical protein
MSELIDGELAHDAKLCSCEHPAAGHARQVGVGLPAPCSIVMAVLIP